MTQNVLSRREPLIHAARAAAALGLAVAAGNSDDAQAGSPGNPIQQTTSGSSVEFTFATPGTFAYYCELRSFGPGNGMTGAVCVR